MMFSPQQAEILSRKIEELLEGSRYLLLLNDQNPDGSIENQILSNLPPEDQKEFLIEALDTLYGPLGS